MEVTEKYANLKERQDKINLREGQYLRMLHDNFDDPNWKHGDPITGTMTFTDIESKVIASEPSRDLVAEVDDLKVRIEKLEKK